MGNKHKTTLKANPVRILKAGETVKARQSFTIDGDPTGRTYWLHPTKGWRSQGRRS